jgi:hypothetical protein
VGFIRKCKSLLMPANLGRHFVGEEFAQQGGGVAMQGARGTGRRQANKEEAPL